MAKSNKAISYIRFSTKRQADGKSLARQQAIAQELCREEGFELLDITYRDLGVSGFKGKNRDAGALGELLKAVKNGTIPKGANLIVENIDRLSRQKLLSTLEIVREITEAGLSLWTCFPHKKKYDAKALADFGTFISLAVEIERSWAESDRKSGLSKKNWEAKQRAARESGQVVSGKCPSWLKVVGEKPNQTYAIDEEKADVVRTIFKWAAEGLGANAIIRRLHAGCFKNPATGKAKWALSTVQLYMQDERVIGYYTPYRQDKKRKGNSFLLFPPIISEEIFHKSQALIRSRKRAGGRPRADFVNILSGLCFDPITGSKYVVDKKRNDSNGNSKRSLRTLASRNKEAGVPHLSIDYAEVVQALPLLNPYHAMEVEESEEPKEEQLLAKIKQMENRCKTLSKKIDQYPDFEDLIDKLYEAKQVLSELRKRLEEERATQSLISDSNPSQLQQALDRAAKGEYNEQARQLLNIAYARIDITAVKYWRYTVGVLDCQWKTGGVQRIVTNWDCFRSDEKKLEYLTYGLDLPSKIMTELAKQIAEGGRPHIYLKGKEIQVLG